VSLGITPSQTVGPFLAIGLPWPDGPYVVPPGTPGAIVIEGCVLDGAGQPVPDALVETWQADPASRFDHPDDPRGPAAAPAGFRGFGRSATDSAGNYLIVTVRPGPLPSPDGGTEAPHLDVSVFARGLLDRVVTRIYFSDEEQANAADPVLASITDAERRATLIAVPASDVAAPGEPGSGGGPGSGEAAGAGGHFRFDIRLQGEHETVFFDV
jgi:protocatechuate 3,4-dioxygenase alpha subunit